MSTKVTPVALGHVLKLDHKLRADTPKRPLAVVEFYVDHPDPVLREVLAQAHSRLQQERIHCLRINIRKHHAELDAMHIRILPQPSTLALYWTDGSQALCQGQLTQVQGLWEALELPPSSPIAQVEGGGGVVDGNATTTPAGATNASSPTPPPPPAPTPSDEQGAPKQTKLSRAWNCIKLIIALGKRLI